MTIVEFFDREMLENIIGTLMFQPERVVLFGRDLKKLAAFQKNMAQVLATKNIHTKILIESVNTTEYASVVKKLNGFIDAYPDCVFDLTGGEELILVAMGAVAAKRNIPLHSINPRSGRVKTILHNSGETRETKSASLTVDEAITLFGGMIEYGAPGSGKTDPLKLDGTMQRDVIALWHILRKNCGDWNAAIEVLSPLTDVQNLDRDGLTFSVPQNYFKSGLKNSSYKIACMESVLSQLTAKGILFEKRTGDMRRFTFKNKQMLRALSKSGTVLELYTLLCVLSAKSLSGSSLVGSAVSGAVIDWENPPDEFDDVKNEIDVLATTGAIPVFISCKNGGVDSGELYKLSTVAERFGGKYAKKILVMTYYNARESFIQRAQAMNIKLIRNVHEMSREEFIKRLSDNMKN